jgi:hypothetical protein
MNREPITSPSATSRPRPAPLSAIFTACQSPDMAGSPACILSTSTSCNAESARSWRKLCHTGPEPVSRRWIPAPRGSPAGMTHAAVCRAKDPSPWTDPLPSRSAYRFRSCAVKQSQHTSHLSQSPTPYCIYRCLLTSLLTPIFPSFADNSALCASLSCEKA